ncbi:MAG: protein translocase subunit SecDF [Sphingobacteriales bacterium]|nr:protein translocase subunit SecDF [Sphingobacteriales bacterium]OJV99678.1 MAG: protein translocase subunit SecDF [Sphingobacteriales bacterium 44-61]
MQLKGLVRFFTILLIIYSIYQLSFTWFVRNHEKKLEARANSYVKVNYPEAKDEVRDSLFNSRLTRLKDSTKDETITYGITGAISYQKAKEEELNLGLDLQGGINVTMEVEMTGLLKTLSNNSKDPDFQKALENANVRKANSDANFIRLFAEEYQKLVGANKMSGLFAAANKDRIKVGDSDSKVIGILESLARDAFDNTFRVMRTRIDQFGVAQPSINPDPEKGIISVELPGVQDKERVRKYLQSSANLQFWEVYNFIELYPSIEKADGIFYAMMGGKAAADTAKKQDTTATAATQSTSGDSASKTLSQLDSTGGKDSTGKLAAADEQDASKHLSYYLQFAVPQQGQKPFPSIGYVAIKDTALVRQYLQTPAIRASFPTQLAWMYGIPERGKNNKPSNFVALYAIKTFGREKAKIEGDAISSASADYDQNGKPEVRMTMTATGSTAWAKMTGENLDKPIAIVLDNIVYSAPNVNQVIDGGTSQISGGFSVQEAQDLANILKAGKLPAPAKIVQEQTVGPTLGAAAIRGGMVSFGVAFIVIFVLMLVYYNSSGWVTNIALVLNLLFTVGILAGLGATLTAPGIAGLILTIGLAVDTNVITKERIKEELTKGKAYLPAVNEAFRRSLPPILDGHITILLTALILFYFGLGPVKGFATTQILGILLSLFSGVLITRWITDIFNKKKIHLEYFTSVSRKIFQQAKFNFIGFRKKAFVISFIVLALGISSFFNGFDYGVEFDGGRSYTVRFDRNISKEIEPMRDELKVTFDGENPVLKTVGDTRTLDITTSYLIKDTRPEVDSIVLNKLYVGLKKHLPENLSFEQFDQRYKLGSKKVLPTISDDLKNGAVKATVFAIFVIFLYIFIRFRDWRYSVGTIIALLHDVLVTLAVFSFARKIVPFPLEIDQHFIAAILTVIGFSMNEAVIIFDRIREDRRLYPSAPLAETINRAINETLSRTIMTSLTVFLTILIIFLVGGEVTRGFAFAMLIGVITGVYSSMFVAAPMLINFGRSKKEKAADLAKTTTASPKATKS